MRNEHDHFIAPLTDIEVRDSGAGQDYVTLRGHAAVFNRDSLDLGGFTEQIAPGAFRDVLNDHPDVHLVSEHDMGRPLARTRNGSLELREDPFGLHVWARMNTSTSYGRDEVVKLRDGLVDGMSFAFTVEPDGEDWDAREDGTIVRTIRRVSGLYDVSVVAQGAYPAARAELVRAYIRAAGEGRIPAGVGSEYLRDARKRITERIAALREGDRTTDEPQVRVPDLVGMRGRLAVAKSKTII